MRTLNAPKKIPISPNLYRGNRITNPLDLLELAKEGQSVVIWHGNNSYEMKPASSVIRRQFIAVALLVSRGMLYNVIQ